jgi:hypothetical protein
VFIGNFKKSLRLGPKNFASAKDPLFQSFNEIVVVMAKHSMASIGK